MNNTHRPDTIVFTSQHKTIGHTNWRIQIYERWDLKDWHKFEYGNCRYTRYQYWDGATWKNETEHPRYNHNDGTYGGLPKGLRTLYYENIDSINYYLQEEEAKELPAIQDQPQQLTLL